MPISFNEHRTLSRNSFWVFPCLYQKKIEAEKAYLRRLDRTRVTICCSTSDSCKKKCPGGLDSECPSGLTCFSYECDGKKKNQCGDSIISNSCSGGDCSSSCTGGVFKDSCGTFHSDDDTSSFDDVVSDDTTDDTTDDGGQTDTTDVPTSYGAIETTTEVAICCSTSDSCKKQCPGGLDSECPSGLTCFSYECDGKTKNQCGDSFISNSCSGGDCISSCTGGVFKDSCGTFQ
jgi:hypothetical protein